MNEEMLKKAGEVKSVDELIALANGYGMELTRAKAEEIFFKIREGGALDDDALSCVAGGRCVLDGNDTRGYKKTSHGTDC